MDLEKSVQELQESITRLDTIEDQFAERQHNYESKMEAELLTMKCNMETELHLNKERY